ncbi:helix-turn-helix domain-containing protein [Rhodanobacter lindaniclasticus]
MDTLITAAAQALAAGDPLGAMTRVALREDAPALALRGLAMAQLGDFRARRNCCDARRARSARVRRRRVRAAWWPRRKSRWLRADWGGLTKPLDAARATLDAHGDHANATHARYLGMRRLLLLGRLDETEQALAAAAGLPLPPALLTVHELLVAGVAMRRLRATVADEALARRPRRATRRPSRADRGGGSRHAHAAGAGRAKSSMARNACWRCATSKPCWSRTPSWWMPVAMRCASVATRSRWRVGPVLFALTRLLGEAWPQDVSREVLIGRAFRARHADEAYRARLRVEIGRLRRALDGLAEVRATTRGFAMTPRHGRRIAVLTWPVESAHAAVLALLGDGESWSSSALALALGRSQRSVQRALEALATAGAVQSRGDGRARRWMMPLTPGFATTLLLPAPLSFD